MQKLDELSWFPGHMAKGYKLIKENLSHVDGVIELLDARVPISSKSPELQKIVGHVPRIILLNKSDLADPKKTSEFKKHSNAEIMELDCSQNEAFDNVLPLIQKVFKFKQQSARSQIMVGRTLKLMVLGIPNVGKSTLINRAAKGKKLQVQNKPGVTRAKQWIKISSGIELLDMPGVLWPKLEGDIGIKLALIGSVRDDILDKETLACWLIEFLRANYPQALALRYKLSSDELEAESFEILRVISLKRALILTKGEPDCLRAAAMLISEFRAGRLGRITLDSLPHENVL